MWTRWFDFTGEEENAYAARIDFTLWLRKGKGH